MSINTFRFLQENIKKLKTRFCQRIYRPVGPIGGLVSNCIAKQDMCPKSIYTQWGRSEDVTRKVSAYHLHRDPENSGVQGLRVTPAWGHWALRMTLHRTGTVTKLQMEYKLVLHTCPDVWKPAFSDRFLWDLTKFFEPVVGVLAGSLTCEGGSLRQCLLLTPEASLLRSFASEPFWIQCECTLLSLRFVLMLSCQCTGHLRSWGKSSSVTDSFQVRSLISTPLQIFQLPSPATHCTCPSNFPVTTGSHTNQEGVNEKRKINYITFLISPFPLAYQAITGLGSLGSGSSGQCCFFIFGLRNWIWTLRIRRGLKPSTGCCRSKKCCLHFYPPSQDWWLSSTASGLL